MLREGGKRTALRGPLIHRIDQPVFHHPGLEKGPNQLEHPFVGDPFGNPRWLGGELGITMVLHTWGQNLGQHLQVHCVVTDGALSLDGERWLTPPRRGFLFPTAALSKVFRGKYLDALAAAHRSGELCMPGDEDPNDTRAFDCLKASLQSNEWIVYTKAPFAGAANVLAYLGRYTH